MRVLFIGDIVGRPGRQMVESRLPGLAGEVAADVVIANGENAAGGIGLTPEVADELFGMGIDLLTMGNHVWDKKEIYDIIDLERRLVRPLNYPGQAPGRGSTVLDLGNGRYLGVLNLSGRVFFPQHLDCPFRAADREVESLARATNCILVDVHGEATSEKVALGWYLDGRVSALVGTHTHVQTADETVLPGGTAYITDVGMTGPVNSVIGIRKELVIERFLTQRPVKFEVARGRCQLCAVVIQIDDDSGRARSITRIIERE